MKTLAISVLALSLSAATVFAQSEAAPGADATLSGPGVTAGAAPVMPVRYVSIQSGDLLSSRLIGTDIYNAQNEEIGEISDIAIADGKAVVGIVASVGGFLGVGTSYVVLDPSSVSLSNADGTWKAHVDTTKEDLSNAPKLDYDKLSK
ncbi:PRC-barrel domain-containing protein [Rhizobium sp. BK176]|uniref:PRC-barrel domain-containing protein n=1 Tax=Rhizobium sp. BK176 TaxID=2587071 RepID=UPI0021670B75|nr:PRC-barrel domain-containing protein [Rhizobium sp. BK176]MCS4088547.1 hypothetical protein [Rhizobium sp. BK176]